MGNLVLKNLTKKYNDNTVVNHVDLEVNNGELLTIVGPSGCGKTTILRMIAGFIEPNHGIISLDGRELFNDTQRKRIVNPEDRDIGMVFQSYAVWPHMNVFENVAYPLKIRKMNKNTIHEKVMKTLSIVHLKGYEDRKAYELSGGQQQRVALARALVMNPQLLLLDEPLSNLDASLREEMRSEIKELQHTLGITIINVTHDQIEAMTMSDKVAIMKDGDLIQFGTPSQCYELPANAFVAKFIGSANVIPAQKKAYEPADDNGMMRVSINDEYELKVPYVGTAATEGFISVRAHHLFANPDATLMAKVTRQLYQGNQFEYYLKLKYGTICRMLTPVEYTAQIGDIVNLDIKKAVWLNE